MRYYLAHSGVKNMRWRQRRWQNPDGSYTDAGFIHYYGHPRIRGKKKERATDIRNYYDVKTGKLKDAGRKEFEKLFYAKENPDKAKAERKNWRERVKRAGYDKKTQTLAKGSKIYRVADEKDKLDGRPKYVSITPTDRDDYREYALSGDLGNRDTKNVYEFQYENARDLKIAEGKRVYDYIFEKYGDTKIKDIVNKKMSTYSNPPRYYNDFVKRYGNVPIKAYKDDIKVAMKVTSFKKGDPDKKNNLRDLANTYSLLNYDFLKTTMYKGGKPTKENLEIQRHFKESGYDAIIDVEDDLWADMPLIVFDPKEKLELKSKRKIGTKNGKPVAM